MTYDYKRHGTTSLFAALNVLDGTVIGKNMQRHRHQEVIRLLGRIEREMQADKAIHVILDNYAAHKTNKVREWLARYPRIQRQQPQALRLEGRSRRHHRCP